MKNQTKTGMFAASLLLLLLPYLLSWLLAFDPEHGMLWLLVQQIYFSPLSWLGQPFFQPDSELGVVVRPYGYMLTTIAYAVLLMFLIKLFHKRKSRDEG